jgi:hypothetical protein
VVSGAALVVAGNRTLEIAARVSDFHEFRTRLEVPIDASSAIGSSL